MALFNKLFSSNKRKNANLTAVSNTPSQFPFNNEQVRILLYRECDWRGRRLLFDSNSVQRVPLASSCHETTKSSGFVEISDGFGYKYSRPNSDGANIGEMVFGSVAMSFRGTALKVHWLHAPTRVLCSQVFLSPVHTNTFGQSTDSHQSTGGSDVNSMDTTSVNSFSLSVSVCVSDNLNILADKSRPLDVPPHQSLTSLEGRETPYSTGDSGYSSTDAWNTTANYRVSSTRSSFGSMYSDQESIRKISIDSSTGDDRTSSRKLSDGNVHRRILKNLSTSFENRASMSDFIGYINDNYCNGSESYISRRRNSEAGENRINSDIIKKTKGITTTDTHIHYNSCPGAQSSSKSNNRRAKLGLAVCITFNESAEKEMQIFCSEHIALLESMLCRLRAIAENAYINRQNFLQIMIRGWHTTTMWVTDLFTAPRLCNPIWLTLSCGNSSNPDNLAHNFMSELSWLLNCADTKDTNFFVSTLLTAILTHHLGWVGTVAPLLTSSIPNSKSKSAFSSSQNSSAAYANRTKISDISKSHPYSALWAQIGDLYGSIGSPPKMSKTIICGGETHAMDKILNILTYFIRCGEITRNPKEKIIEKDVISNIMENMNEHCVKNVGSGVKRENVSENVANKNVGMVRTATCLKDLKSLMTTTEKEDDDSIQVINDKQVEDLFKIFKKNVMNDIPNVLVYRDSRFVQQELRIGNFQMDTGIEMNQKLKSDLKMYQSNGERIKLTLTSPDNVEYSLRTSLDDISLSHLITENSLGANQMSSSKLFWDATPVRVDENDEADDLSKFQRSRSLYTKSSNAKSTSHILRRSKILRKTSASKIATATTADEDECDGESTLRKVPSLSDLITSNSLGSNQRLLWGIEPGLELRKSSDTDDDESEAATPTNATMNGVVFVLGENEQLVDIRNSKKPFKLSAAACSYDDITQALDPKLSTTTAESIAPSSLAAAATASSNLLPTIAPASSSLVHNKMCKHKFKKHSGVKFNFEQYPQIATNYMKNKNLDISNLNFFEKGFKIEQEMRLNSGASTSTPAKTIEEEEDECECCRGAGGGQFLTTPSNASELEFSCDLSDNNDLMETPQNASELEYSCNQNDTSNAQHYQQVSTSTSVRGVVAAGIAGEKDEKILVKASTAAAKENGGVKIISIPMPKTKLQSKDKEISSTNRAMLIFDPGFIPSLFIGISDHYIPDMVLQGTSAPAAKWESSLKNDLVLASHCAILEQTPTENIAIIGNVDKWEVRLISSQTFVLPTGTCSGGPVGMSQLVASMLETVHAMWGAGTPAYHCMSYMESKLQELYFQSETLAAFLLDTEFCSLNKLTSALNLTINDVPLLLSVASIHSPQVTKKYGLSFR